MNIPDSPLNTDIDRGLNPLTSLAIALTISALPMGYAVATWSGDSAGAYRLVTLPFLFLIPLLLEVFDRHSTRRMPKTTAVVYCIGLVIIMVIPVSAGAPTFSSILALTAMTALWSKLIATALPRFCAWLGRVSRSRWVRASLLYLVVVTLGAMLM